MNNEVLQKLKQIKAQNALKSSKLEHFDDLVVIYLDTEPVQHFPKLLDENGQKVQKIENGKKVDVRSDESDGWTYTFVEYITCKTIKVVLENRIKVEAFRAYVVAGDGYNIKNSNLIFIEKNGKIGLLK